MSRFRMIPAGIAVAAAVLFATAVPASAHDELLSSTPAEGEQLAAAPASVSLGFSADVLELGATVIVADADDRDWAAGAPVVQAGSVETPLADGMPAGGYEVRWRVVSSDGHPISGVIPFTVGDAAPLENTATPSATPTDAAGGAATPTGTTAPDVDLAAQATPDGGGALRIALIGGAGAVGASAVFVAILLIRRRARAGGTDDSAS